MGEEKKEKKKKKRKKDRQKGRKKERKKGCNRALLSLSKFFLNEHVSLLSSADKRRNTDTEDSCSNVFASNEFLFLKN